MKRFYLTCICLLMMTLAAFAQQRVSEAQAEVMQMQVRELVANYFANLNSIGDKDLEFSDRELILASALKNFESRDVLVFNDLDPSRKESASLKAEVYLGNIVTKYAKGLSFETSGIDVSEVFYDKGLDRNFLKAEVIRSMQGTHINQKVSRNDTVDIYIAFVKDASAGKIGQPVIYAIEPHRNNLDSFVSAQRDQRNGSKASGWRSMISNIGRKSAPAVPSKPLEITKSPAGKKYAAGSSMTIRWTSQAQNQVKGDLYRGEQLVRTLFTEPGSRQEYKWKIPAGMPAASNYTLRLSSVEDESISELTGRFAIRKRNKYRKWMYVGAGAVAATTLYMLYNAGANQGGELPGFPDPP